MQASAAVRSGAAAAHDRGEVSSSIIKAHGLRRHLPGLSLGRCSDVTWTHEHSRLAREKENKGNMGNEDLVLQYQSSRDESERRRLIGELYQRNEGLVGKIASSYKGLEIEDDLKQEGFFGLVAAADNWDPRGGASFGSYAYKLIRQSIRRYLDECGSVVRVPSMRRSQIFELRRFCADYESLKGYPPDDQTIAAALSITVEVVARIRAAEMLQRPLSISEALPEGGTLADILPDPSDTIEDLEDHIQHEQLSAALWAEVEDLPDRERQIIRDRFKGGKTLQECGDRLGVACETARKLEAVALRRLRRKKRLQAFLESKAESYGYHASGLRTFRRTGSSSVELAVLDVERAHEKGII